MKCTECSGTIDLANAIGVRVGCHSSANAYACSECGRLHFLIGDEVHKRPVGVQKRSGELAYLIDGEMAHRKSEKCLT